MKNKKKLVWLVLTFICIIGSMAFAGTYTKASEKTLTLKELNYEKSTITIQSSHKDTVVYFSDSAKKKWEKIPGTLNDDGSITLDISWISVSKNHVITFKGDVSTSVLSVTIPKQVTTFKATFNKLKGSCSFSNHSDRDIEWRKKDSTTWQKVTDNLGKELESLYTNGATIVFRLAPVNGLKGDVGMRASKEVSVAIPKKTSAPIVSVDGSKLLISVKGGMSYRFVKSNGTVSDWTQVKSTQNLLLSEKAPSVLYVNSSTEQNEVVMQFRTDATSSSQVSQITTVTIPVQSAQPDETKEGISLSYTSATTLSLQIKSANSTTPYEYTIVEEGKALNLLEAVWTTISSSTAVSITNKKAPEGSHIYVRKKTKAASSSTEFALATAYIDLTGTKGVQYPSQANMTGITKLVSIAGICNADNTNGNLQFTLYSPTKTTVSKITFKDAYGNVKGDVACTSTVTANTNKTGSDDAYIITAKITSTDKINSYTEEKLYADITLENTDVIESSEKNGVSLFLYPASKIDNPSKDGYSVNFERVVGSKESEDEKEFAFCIEYGIAKLPDSANAGTLSSTATDISSIVYDGYTLAAGKDYTVKTEEKKNTSGETVTVATVKVDVSSFETNADIKKRDSAEYLVITLNNQEVIAKGIKLNLVSTATLSESPIAWAITEGSLKETISKTTTDDKNVSTTVVEDVNSYVLTLNVFKKSYAVAVTDVTFGGVSVLDSAILSDGKIKVTLSNKKINKLTTSSSTTDNLVFKLSNGYEITSGCKLTILKKLAD